METNLFATSSPLRRVCMFTKDNSWILNIDTLIHKAILNTVEPRQIDQLGNYLRTS